MRGSQAITFPMLIPAFPFALPRNVFSFVFAGLVLATARLGAADYVLADAFVSDPSSHVQADATKTFRASDTIIVPTLYLRVVTDGSIFVAKGAGSSTASAKGSYSVHGLDRAALLALATQLQDNFVAQLRKDGWKVLTYEDIKADAEVVQMTRNAPENALGFPQEKDRAGQMNFAIVTPTDAQNFKPAMQGTHWTFRHVAKARNATVVIPHLDIVAPQVWGESRKGYKSATAEVKTAPGLNLNSALILALNGKGGGGMVFKSKYPVVGAEPVGTFSDAKDKSPTAANGISKGLSILGGGGSINRSSAAYQFAIDSKAFGDAALRSGDRFLAHVAKVIATEKP